MEFEKKYLKIIKINFIDRDHMLRTTLLLYLPPRRRGLLIWYYIMGMIFFCSFWKKNLSRLKIQWLNATCKKMARICIASISTSDGSGVPEIGFSGTWNHPKNGFKHGIKVVVFLELVSGNDLKLFPTNIWIFKLRFC